MERAAGAGLVLWVTAAWPAARAADVVDPFTEPDESELLRAEERVVTVASRYAQTVARASSVVTVVTAAEIRERGYRSLADVLGTIPGFYIAVSEEGRKLAWVRGVSAEDNSKVLLLVDGVPWYDGLYNHAWIDEYLPLQTVRQVEVIRGPVSANYGTNAFAAVINVVTYTARDLRGGFVRAEVGSFGRQGVTAVFGDRVGETHPIGVRVYARALAADGDGLDLLPDGSRDVNGDAPREALGAGMQLELRGLTVRYDHVEYRHDPLISEQDDALDLLLSDTDTFAYRYSDDMLAARWELRVGPWARLTPEAFAQLHDDPGVYAWISPPEHGGEDWDIGMVEAEKRTARYGLALRTELRPWLDHVTALGVGATADHLLEVEDRSFQGTTGLAASGSFVAPRALLTDIYLYGQHQWAPAWWLELYGGIRVDQRGYVCREAADLCDMPEDHSALSPRLGFTLAPDGAISLKTSYSRAFRSPNAREVLVDVDVDPVGGNSATASNPALRPEVIDMVEAELQAHPVRPLTLRVDGYAGRLRDTIEKVSGYDDELGDVWYENTAGSDLVGLESEVGLDLPRLQLWASYGYTHAVDRETGNLAYGFPPQIGHGRLTWKPVSHARVSLLGDVVGSRPQAAWSPDAGAEDGEAYGLLHLAFAADGLANGRVRADLSVRNLLGTRYTRPLPRDEVNAVDEVLVYDETGASETVLVSSNPYTLEGEGRRVVVGLEVSF